MFWKKHKYSLEELADFERDMNVVLPDAHKRYLVEVGAGEPGSKVSVLEDCFQPYSREDLPPDFLSQAFPFRDAWNDLSLLEEKAGWQSPYFDPMLFRGSIRISNRGCEDYYLLVVSGDERGNMWADGRAGSKKGIYPLRSRRGERMTVEKYPWGRPKPLKSLDRLCRRLDGCSIPDSLELDFAKHGRKAFDRLLEDVSARVLSDRETRNAINLMFRLTREAAFGAQKRLQELCLELSADARESVRSEAVVTLIRLTLLGESMPQMGLGLASREAVLPSVSEAVKRGLEADARSYAEAFLARGA